MRSLEEADVFALEASHVPHIHHRPDNECPLGLYVVVQAEDEGGFSPGHHVYCECLEDRSVTMSFYQQDRDSCPMRNIATVGRAEWELVFEEGGD